MSAEIVSEPTAPSGFAKSDAEALGVLFFRVDEPASPAYVAEFDRLVAFEGDTLEQILGRIEDWHLTRLRMGVAAPVPVVVSSPASPAPVKAEPVAAGPEVVGA